MNRNIAKWITGLGAACVIQISQANTVAVVDLGGSPVSTGGGTQYTAACLPENQTCMEAILGTAAPVSSGNGNNTTFSTPASGTTRWSASTGTGYSLNQNPAGELAFLNALLASIALPSSIPLETAVQKYDVGAQSFTTNKEYFSIKQSTWTVFFQNTSGAPLTVAFNPVDFSHWTEYGGVVPLPAAAWLFGSALLAFIGLSRREHA